MIWLGIFIGFIVGALALGWTGGLAGGFVGFILTLAWRSRAQAKAKAQALAAGAPSALPIRPSSAVDAVATGAEAPTAEVLRRLTAIEQRLAVLEAAAGVVPAETPRDTMRSTEEAATPFAPAGRLATRGGGRGTFDDA